MTRKKVRLARILNESARKASLKKRRAGLFKKAEELCVLCDVQTGIVLYSPDEAAAAPAVWPSQEEMEGVMAKFLTMPEIEGFRKSSTLESYLTERMEKEEVKMNKAEKKNDEKEMEEIMWQLVEGNMDVNGLVDVNQLNGLSLLAVDMLAKFHKRNQQIMISSLQNAANHPSAPPPPPPQVVLAPVDEAAAPVHGDIGDRDVRTLNIPTSMEQLMNDPWFMDTMTHHQEDIDHIGGPSTTSTSGGNELELPPEYAAGTSRTKDKELPDAFNNSWPHICSP